MSSVNVSLINSVTRKAQLVTLPRDVTIADLRSLAGSESGAAFSVGGCTPAPATTLGDLYDTCATDGQLEVHFSTVARMGGFFCCGPVCGRTPDPATPQADHVIITTTPGQLYEDNPGLTTGSTGLPNINFPFR